MSFWAELQRRNVVRVSLAYVAMAWLLVQVADLVFPVFDVSPWVLKLLIVAFVLGIPVVLILAWVFELTPEGVRRTDDVRPGQGVARPAGRKLDFSIIGLLALALAFVVIDQYVLEAPSLPVVESIAVLPLTNLSGDSEQEYFADGITEALITSLARIAALRVISRTSVMTYKGVDKPLPEIAAELDVGAIVEGSAQREGDRVRVTAQLIDARTDQHLWADSYDRNFADVLILQNEIARTIARQIEIRLSPGDRMRLAPAREVNPEAYEAYLKGRQHYYRLTPTDLDTALRYFEFALEKDPTSALAYTGIAAVWGGRQQMGYVLSSEATPKTKAAALKAVSLDDGLAEAHFHLAAIHTWIEWNWAAAEREYKRAIELNPSHPDARALYSHLLLIVGRPDEAMREIERALRLDPFNPFFQALHCINLNFVRRYDEAIAQCRAALKVSPHLPVAWTGLTHSLYLTGRYTDVVEAQRAMAVALGDREAETALTSGYAAGGYAAAMRSLADLAAARSLATGSAGMDVASSYCWAGDHARAIEWLERAFDQRDPNLPYLGSPLFDPVRDDPRVVTLRRRMGLAE